MKSLELEYQPPDITFNCSFHSNLELSHEQINRNFVGYLLLLKMSEIVANYLSY